MVALAVLMPIVASMGGNAGTQAMTVTVRALATRELGRRKIRRIVGREVMVGLINGVLLSVLLGPGQGSGSVMRSSAWSSARRWSSTCSSPGWWGP